MSSRNKRDVGLAEGSVLTLPFQIPYDAFGRTETVMHWQPCIFHEAARGQWMLHAGVLGKDGAMTDNSNILMNTRYSLFAIGVDYIVSTQLWKIRQYETGQPYTTMSVWLSHLGTTSLTICSQMVLTPDNQELSTALAKFVYIDRTTRRPSPLPDWFRAKFSSALTTERILKISTFQPMASTSLFCYDVTVTPSDIDSNGHMNQANYVRICCDGAYVAVKAGKLPGYEGDIYSYNLKGLQVLYFGECNVGDKLKVLLWQQPDHPEKMYFIVKQEGKESAMCQVSMTYGGNFPTPAHKL